MTQKTQKELRLKDRLADFPHDIYSNYGQAPVNGLKLEMTLKKEAPHPSAFFPIVQALKIMKLESKDKLIWLDARGKREVQNIAGLKARETVGNTLNYLKKKGFLVPIHDQKNHNAHENLYYGKL